MAATPNFGYALPVVGGDNNAWGTELNANWSAVDSDLQDVSDVATAALPKAGGVMAGRLDGKTGTVQTAGLVTIGGGSFGLDLAVANVFDFTVSADTTLVLQNVPSVATSLIPLVLRITNGGSHTLTYPTGFKFPAGTAPSLGLSGLDILAFISVDGGSTWDCVGYQLAIS